MSKRKFEVEMFTINTVMRDHVFCWQLWNRDKCEETAIYYDRLTAELCCNYLNVSACRRIVEEV